MGRKIFRSKFILLLILAALGVLSYFFSIEFKKRYVVEREIQNMDKQIAGLEKNNSELSNLIGYLQSPSFQEKEIRQKLNLQKPGEHVVVLPSEKTDGTLQSAAQDGAAQKPNWQKWWDYFFN